MNSVRPLSISISALGGQGGGVLTSWIVDLAESNGYLAQSTAIAGVAQRTGTTIYAVEIYPESEIKKACKEPVLALMPVKGDVDICIAAELMEAGRAVNRGFVTADRTTLIASDHRVYAISEKENMADGRVDSETVRNALKKSAKKVILFDMEDAVTKSSSVISSVLFGALAGSGALPFEREKYEATIRKSGRAVNSNLAGFELGYLNSQGNITTRPNDEKKCEHEKTVTVSPLLRRIEKLPTEAQAIATYGVHRLVDYQDAEYAQLYLNRLEEIKNDQIVLEVARYLALWMGFDDVIRVADLKTRGDRSEKIATEIRVHDDQIWYGYDYFHPRFEEFVDILPVRIGRALSKSYYGNKIFSPLFSKGRLIRPKTILGYLMLRFVANLRFMRLRTLKYKTENKRIVAWLNLIKKNMVEKPSVALEIASCPRLIKGYGDTYARGMSRFSAIMAYVEQNENENNLAQEIANLRDAAQISAEGTEFLDSLKSYNNGNLKDNDGQKCDFTQEFSWTGSSGLHP